MPIPRASKPRQREFAPSITIEASMHSVAAWFVVLSLALASQLLGCDTGISTGGLPVVCTESGVQCQLEAGPLGVCERAPCRDGASPPCFSCAPQH